MPKEVTHWVIADEVAGKLENSFFKSALSNRNELLTGAIFHDIIYFYRGKNPDIKIIPDHLHGSKKEDTFDIIRKLLGKLYSASDDDAPRLTAFMVGALSHIFTDNHFHPMVYYMTGNYYDRDPKKKTKAITRHRTLEGIIDQYFCKNFRDVYKFKKIFKECKEVLPGLLSGLYSVEKDGKACDIKEDTYGSYKFFNFFRKIYANRLIGNIVRAVDFLFPSSLKETSAIFYSGKFKKYIPALSGKNIYHNPVTNDKFEKTLEELKSQAVNDTVNFCLLLEKEYLNKSSADIKETGASLETGLEKSDVDDMKYFDIFKM